MMKELKYGHVTKSQFLHLITCRISSLLCKLCKCIVNLHVCVYVEYYIMM